jgi:hypothetical protein
MFSTSGYLQILRRSLKLFVWKNLVISELTVFQEEKLVIVTIILTRHVSIKDNM